MESTTHKLPKGWADIVGRIQALSKLVNNTDEAILFPILDTDGISPKFNSILSSLRIDSSVHNYLTPWESHWLDVLTFYRFVLTYIGGSSKPEDAMDALEGYVTSFARLSSHRTGGTGSLTKQVQYIETFILETIAMPESSSGLTGLHLFNVVLVNPNSIQTACRLLYGLPSYPVSNQASGMRSALMTILDEPLPKRTVPTQNSIYAAVDVSVYGHPILAAPCLFKRDIELLFEKSLWHSFGNSKINPMHKDPNIELVTVTMRPLSGHSHLTYSEHQFRVVPSNLPFLLMSNRQIFDPKNAHLYWMEVTHHYSKDGKRVDSPVTPVTPPQPISASPVLESTDPLLNRIMRATGSGQE